MDWSVCEKQQARLATIIQPYRDLFAQKISADRQYWTFCGLHADDDGKLRKGSELDQMVTSGLIESNQFFGVEIDSVTANKNRQIVTDANWIEGDFYQKCVGAGKSFQPAIVNLDTTKMPTGSMAYLGKVMRLIEIENVMVVINFVKKYRHRKITYDAMVEEIEQEPQMQRSLSNGWKMWSPLKDTPMAYRYPAHGGKNNYMATIVMYKKQSTYNHDNRKTK